MEILLVTVSLWRDAACASTRADVEHAAVGRASRHRSMAEIRQDEGGMKIAYLCVSSDA
jgi:hypothetical protein